MKSVFLFGNSFIISQIIFDINLLTNLSCQKIILLTDIKRHYYCQQDIQIVFYDTIEACVIDSDVVIMFNDNVRPIDTISKIIRCAENHHKCYFVFKTYNSEWDESSNALPEQYIDEVSNKPVVLSICFGAAAASLSCELMLSRIFKKNQISVYHIFSPQNRYLIDQFNKSGLLNNSIKVSMEEVKSSSVILVNIDAEKNPHYLRRHFNYINMLLPDYILFFTDYEHNNYSDLQNVSNHICDRSLDCWIKSRYYLIIQKEIFSYQKKPPNNKQCYDIEDRQSTDMLEFDILSKIAYPSGMKIYK